MGGFKHFMKTLGFSVPMAVSSLIGLFFMYRLRDENVVPTNFG